MWLIFAFGLTGVGAAGRFAWRGEHQLVAFVRWISVTVFACGWFGFFIGTQKMLSFIIYRLPATLPPASSLADERTRVLFEGTKEALNCVSGSLLFVVVICLLGAIGYRRFPMPNPGSVAR